MRILHILSSNQFSGAENVVCQIINFFRNSEIEMVYASPDGIISEALKLRGITFFPMHTFSVREIKRVIREVSPDILHAHDMRASLFTVIGAGGTPVIAHIHNNGYDARKLTLKSLGFLLSSFRLKHIFWVSGSAYRDYYFGKYVKDKSSVLLNIVDIEDIKKRAEIGIVKEIYDIIFLGRLSYPKNPLRFVNIMDLLKRKLPDVKVAIIGDGEQAQETKDLIHKLKLDKNITLLGFKKNPMCYLKMAKALVMTSFWEGTPMCALEALSLGVPVLSTPVDGLKEIIVNNINGMLSNDNQELADTLYEILTNPEYSARLSSNASYEAKRINNSQPYIEALNNAYKKAYFSKNNISNHIKYENCILR